MKSAFIITHYVENAAQLELFERTLASLYAQSDTGWIAVIVDDGSPFEPSRALLRDLSARDPDRIHIVDNIASGGAGAARNLGIRRAASLGAEIILHSDNDDLSHPERLARTKALFAGRPEVEFVYTDLQPIDAADAEIPVHLTRLDTVEIMEALRADPPQGSDVFAAMAAETGCLIIPSTAAMRTPVAQAYRFPGGFASEDNHTWLRMAAAGVFFAHLPDTPLGYRIWRPEISDLGENGRNRRFLWEKARNDIDGFECGVHIARTRGVLQERALLDLTWRFLDRVAACVGRQGETGLAARLRSGDMRETVLDRLRLPAAARGEPKVLRVRSA